MQFFTGRVLCGVELETATCFLLLLLRRLMCLMWVTRMLKEVQCTVYHVLGLRFSRDLLTDKEDVAIYNRKVMQMEIAYEL